MQILYQRGKNDGCLKEKLKILHGVLTFHFVVSSRTTKECTEMKK